ncbi:MAG: LppX_LprAFG lipoprotein [Ktedonobacteraceae bacterium]|nr:LppX_LprAFG lipoprotein [Chloroflexota bacterium]
MRTYPWLVRASRAPVLSGLIALVLLLAACGGGGSSSNTPTAQQLIASAQAAIQKVTAYHFNLKVDNPGTGATLVIQTADGDIVVPDKLQANASALVIGSAIQVKFVSVDDKEYITDPITGKWQLTTGLIDPRTLSDSKTGVASILGNIQKPGTPSDSNVDGTSCWSINGKLDAKYLGSIIGDAAQAGSIVDVTTCIGKADNRPYLIRITGIATQGDTSKTVRTFKLSKFGETVTITAPI